ncbi:ferredoxin [Streptomyces flaveolus]|uniref:ferredoxin n=1 Tax=Streptomyces flaveolus TaxID=67297 RepID=UPI001835617A|nr:ferredoxin [Streptomyces sp.]
MKIIADTGRCIGAGQCVMAADSVFDQDPATGEVVLLVARAPADEVDAVLDAVSTCPTGALATAED